MWGFGRRQVRQQRVRPVRCESLEQAVQGVLASRNEVTMQVSDLKIQGNNQSFSCTGRNHGLTDYPIDSLARRIMSIAGPGFKVSIFVAGFQEAPNLAQALDPGWRPYAMPHKSFSQNFSMRKYHDWRGSNEARRTTLTRQSVHVSR